jgi:hypothetical protein
MITGEQFMTGVVMGVILMVIGLVPRVLEKCTGAITNLAEALLSRFYGVPAAARNPAEFGEQRWIGALGMALIALSLYLYTAP